MARRSALTDRQQRFVDEYLLDLNATQAAIRAGYSARTANEQAARLLANVSVGAAVRTAQAARSERTKIDADWLLNRLVEETDATLDALYAEDGSIRPIKDWPMAWRRGLVAGVETEEKRNEDGTVTTVVSKVKLSDRTRRLEMIGRHVGVQAFRDQVGIGNPAGGPVEVNANVSAEEAYRRMKEL